MLWLAYMKDGAILKSDTLIMSEILAHGGKVSVLLLQYKGNTFSAMPEPGVLCVDDRIVRSIPRGVWNNVQVVARKRFEMELGAAEPTLRSIIIGIAGTNAEGNLRSNLIYAYPDSTFTLEAAV